uniref:FCH and mu domain containing endocytic adaptor 2 n=1 Tax=Gadus morhua TaxID=8049 RepID=A0A8C5BM57_GADMO
MQGEKNNGFDVLYHNMKHGQISSKELTDFIRESAIEEAYARSVTKLAKSAGNFSPLGTFAPVWDVFRSSTEKLAACHLELVRKLQELIKEVQKYVDDQAKAHKKTKEEVASTLEAVQNIQTTSQALTKSKEAYNAKTVEQERLRKEGATQREVDKAGVKAKKATETYKSYVEKYATAKSEFEQKMAETAQKFQDIEESHVLHMKEIIQSYSQSVEETHVQIGEVHTEFVGNMENTSLEGLVQKLAESKGTGKERPIHTFSVPLSLRVVFVSGAKPRKRKTFAIPENSFYSSSDSDDEDEPRKFRVEIKPVQAAAGPQGAAIDELKASIGSIVLSPSALVRSPPLGSQGVSGGGGGGGGGAVCCGMSATLGGPALARPTTPLTAGALVPPPRPSSRPKLPTGKLSGINEIVSRTRWDGVFLYPGTQNNNTRVYIFLTPGTSRGPSPITLASHDALPIAVAFTESVNAYFKGADPSKCIVKITGDMTLSFPMGIIKVFTSNPSPAVLTFRLKNTSRLEQVLPNQQLLHSDASQSDSNSKDFWFNMPALMSYLRKAAEQNPTASYYNVDILKYQVHSSGIQSTPLNLAVYWKCAAGTTDLCLDYRFNPEPMSGPGSLANVQILVPVDGGVTSMQALPNGIWNAEQKKFLWKLSDISDKSDNEGAGSLRAKFELSSGPSTPATLAVQFMNEGSTLSGVDMELQGPGYRLSLTKKRFATGRYMADC